MTQIPSSPVQSQRGTDERERWIKHALSVAEDQDCPECVAIADMLRADAEQLRALDAKVAHITENENKLSLMTESLEQQLRALEQRLEAYKLLDSGSLSEQVCAWEIVAATLSEVVPDWHSLSDNGTDAACLAIRQLRARDEEIAGLRKALELSRYWLANCTPLIAPDAEHPLPLPIIDAALQEKSRDAG